MCANVLAVSPGASLSCRTSARELPLGHPATRRRDQPPECLVTSSLALPPLRSPPATPPAPSPSFAEQYERFLVRPLFEPWARLLLDRVPLARGASVLDVACGTGIVARIARRRVGDSGRVVGTDRSAPMLAVARAIEPAVEWREGDATGPLAVGGERFDAVFCHQGLQFFDDRPAAVRAMRRALVPGGRLGVGVWRALEENELFHDLVRVAERFVGPVEDTRHAFPDADALHRLLREAGFDDVEVEPLSRETRFELDPAVLARLNAMAVIGRTACGQQLSESERAKLALVIAEESLATVALYSDGSAITCRTSANLATARA